MDFSVVAELPGLLLVGDQPMLQVRFQNKDGRLNDKGQLEGFIDAVRSQPQTDSRLDVLIPLASLLSGTLIASNGHYKDGHLVFSADQKPVLDATRQLLQKLARDIKNFRYE